ncbi:MAG: transposase [Coriobacteriales bacterium]|nr:transposase [Coriobacteriales bacterium]
MTYVIRRQSSSDYYHVTTRGVGRQLLFECEADKQKLKEALLQYKAETQCVVIAWCFMDNHIHLLLHGILGNISTLMRKLLTGYAMYYNTKYSRSGHLFQGRFFSEPIESDEQLLTTVRYIHQNPDEITMTDFRQYRWSSYREYLSEREGITNTELILQMFGSRALFIQFHDEHIAKKDLADDITLSKSRLTQEEANCLVKEICGEILPHDIKTLGKPKRDTLLCSLKQAGLSIRQIERITGISRYIIAEA